MILVQRRKDHLEEKFKHDPGMSDTIDSGLSLGHTFNRSRMSNLGLGGANSNAAAARASKVQKSMASRRSVSMNLKVGDRSHFLSHASTVKSPIVSGCNKSCLLPFRTPKQRLTRR